MYRRNFILRLMYAVLGSLPVVGVFLRRNKLGAPSADDTLRPVYVRKPYYGDHPAGMSDNDIGWWSCTRMKDLRPGDEFVMLEDDGTFVLYADQELFLATSAPTYKEGGCYSIECVVIRSLSMDKDFTFPEIVWLSDSGREPYACTRKALKSGDSYFAPQDIFSPNGPAFGSFVRA